MFPQDLDVIFPLFLHSIGANFYRKRRRWHPYLVFSFLFVWICSPPTWMYFSYTIKISSREEKARGRKKWGESRLSIFGTCGLS
jgi:hypothetical protein